MEKLAAIQSKYGILHLFLRDGDDEDLAHGLYRYIVEDLYDNEEARVSENFGKASLAYEQEEYESSGDEG
jgi:hypothetical protein